jgi:hypothetical protein
VASRGEASFVKLPAIGAALELHGLPVWLRIELRKP